MQVPPEAQVRLTKPTEIRVTLLPIHNYLEPPTAERLCQQLGRLQLLEWEMPRLDYLGTIL
jgi:hypothetical protein